MKGKEVKEIRLKLGMTQEQFAVKLGVSASTVMNWERNKHSPSRLAEKAIIDSKQ